MTATPTAATTLTRPRETTVAARFHAPRELHADEVLAECGPFVLTAWGMYATREATFEEWERAGQFARTMHTAARWCEVDWLGYGMFQWSEEYAQAFDGDAYSEGYVANLETLYRNFPLERRLQWRLPISVFQALCPLVTEAQDKLLPMIAAAWKGKNRMTRDDVRRLVAEQPNEARKRQRPTRPGPQVATLPAPLCSRCGGVRVQLASGAYGCLVCEDVCPDCGNLRYGPDAPHTCSPSGNGSHVPTEWAHAPEAEEIEAMRRVVLTTHDRAASLEDAEPEYVPARPAGMAATVRDCYGRQVVLIFDDAPDLHEGQRVMVVTEVV